MKTYTVYCELKGTRQAKVSVQAISEKAAMEHVTYDYEHDGIEFEEFEEDEFQVWHAELQDKDQ